MRRAREDEVSEADANVQDPDDAREDDANVISRTLKRARTAALLPLVFVTFNPGKEIEKVDNPTRPYYVQNFYFTSQDVSKRNNVFHAIRELARTNNGPRMVAYLLALINDSTLDVDRFINGLRTETTRTTLQLYKMRLNPQPGEWSAQVNKPDIIATPTSTVTIIGWDPRPHPRSFNTSVFSYIHE